MGVHKTGDLYQICCILLVWNLFVVHILARLLFVLPIGVIYIYSYHTSSLCSLISVNQVTSRDLTEFGSVLVYKMDREAWGIKSLIMEVIQQQLISTPK